MRLVRIGYWAGDQAPNWPDPHRFVDEAWDANERDIVVDYVRRGFVAHAFLGKSPCRFCGDLVGSLELTDGVYLWPDGLAHYLAVHAVRLPAEFVDHVLRQTQRLEDADISEEWWAGQQCLGIDP